MWQMVDEKIEKSTRGFQSPAQDVTVSGNGQTESVSLRQGRNIVTVDPKQVQAIHQRLIQLGALKPAVSAG